MKKKPKILRGCFSKIKSFKKLKISNKKFNFLFAKTLIMKVLDRNNSKNYFTKIMVKKRWFYFIKLEKGRVFLIKNKGLKLIKNN